MQQALQQTNEETETDYPKYKYKYKYSTGSEMISIYYPCTHIPIPVIRGCGKTIL